MRFKVERLDGGHAVIRFWKAGCRSRYADYGECGKIALEAKTRLPRERERGYVRAWQPGDGRPAYVAVTMVEVGEQRKGHGTRLYERAARLACSTFKAPLASDTTGDRSSAAEGFWQKQIRKGRARRLHFQPWDPSGQERFRRVNSRYALRCPAPKSLAGLTARKRRRGR